VEYYPSTRGEDVKHKVGAVYLGVIERASDGFTVLSIRTPDAKRAHNIEVGQVYAVTVRGQRHVLATPWSRWRVRSAEIRRLVEGDLEEWAKPYFDPASHKYFRRQPDYEEQTDAAAEQKHRRLVVGERHSRRNRGSAREQHEGSGCLMILMLLLVGGLIAAGLHFLG
jgi:1,2-phenylacetyl-CoA epoxidase PaaB subunit